MMVALRQCKGLQRGYVRGYQAFCLASDRSGLGIDPIRCMDGPGPSARRGFRRALALSLPGARTIWLRLAFHSHDKNPSR